MIGGGPLFSSLLPVAGIISPALALQSITSHACSIAIAQIATASSSLDRPHAHYSSLLLVFSLLSAGWRAMHAQEQQDSRSTAFPHQQGSNMTPSGEKASQNIPSSFSFSCPSSSLPPPGRVVRPSSLSRQSSVRAGRAEKRRKKSSCQSQLEIVCSLRLSFTHSHANATHSTQISVW